MKTTINGKEIKLYGDKELSEIITNKVTEYLANGFLIWYTHCSGSQGEEMKVDLSNDNGNTVYRIWMEKIYSCSRLGDGISIFIEKYTNAKNKRTLWRNKGETVFEKSFVCINDSFCKDIYCDAENKTYFENKIRDRFDSKYFFNGRNINVSKKVLLRCVKAQKGYKSVKEKDIVSIIRYAGTPRYLVTFTEESKKSNLLLCLK